MVTDHERPQKPTLPSQKAKKGKLCPSKTENFETIIALLQPNKTEKAVVPPLPDQQRPG